MHARELTRRLADLLRKERGALAEFLVALADFDRDRGWLQLGYSSLFYFLHRELGLSKGASYHRKVAAELLQRFPEVIEPLRDGRLCLSSIVELGRVITTENRSDVVPRFFHCSKREAAAVSVEIVPKTAPHRVMITAVGASAARLLPEQSAARPCCHAGEHVDGLAAGSPAARETAAPEAPRPREAMARSVEGADAVGRVGGAAAVHLAEPEDDARARSSGPASVHLGELERRVQSDSVEPLTADLRRLHVTVTRRFLEKLDAARDALSHAKPGSTVEEVLESALDVLLQRHAKRKGLVEKPRSKPRPSKSDRIPASVKRQVWTRDRGCCQWPVASGGVCGSSLRLEFDHVKPRARRGPATVDNVRLLCRVHNQLAARLAFGDELLDRFTTRPRGGPARTTSTGETEARGCSG